MVSEFHPVCEVEETLDPMNGPASILRRFPARVVVAVSLLLASFAVAWYWHGARLVREARRAAANERWGEAIALTKAHLREHPNDSRAIVLLARCFGSIGQFEEAERLFSRVPLSAEDLAWRGNMLLSAKWYSRAAPVYERLVEIDSDNWDAIKHLAVLLLREGRVDDATAMATRLVNESSQAAVGQFLTGLLHLHQGRSEQAIVHLEKVVELDPSASSLPQGNTPETVYMLLAETLIGRGQPHRARTHIEQFLKTHPASARALSLLGTISLDLGDADAARGYWDKSLAINPHQCDLKGRIAQMEMHHGRPARALEILQKLEKECPSTMILHSTLAIAYSVNGKPDEAKKHYEEADRLRREQVEKAAIDEFARRSPLGATLVNAQTAIDQGNYREAEVLLQELSAVRPDSARVRELLNYVRMLMKGEIRRGDGVAPSAGLEGRAE